MAEVTYDWYQPTYQSKKIYGKWQQRASLTEGCQQQGEVAPQLLQRQGSQSAGKCGRMLESLEPLPLQWKGKVQRKNQSPPTVHVEEIVSIEIISGLSCLSGIHRYRSAGYEWIWLHDCISSLRVSADLLSSNSSSAVAKSLLVMFSFCRLGLKRKAMGRTANTFSYFLYLEARLLDLFIISFWSKCALLQVSSFKELDTSTWRPCESTKTKCAKSKRQKQHGMDKIHQESSGTSCCRFSSANVVWQRPSREFLWSRPSKGTGPPPSQKTHIEATDNGWFFCSYIVLVFWLLNAWECNRMHRLKSN